LKAQEAHLAEMAEARSSMDAYFYESREMFQNDEMLERVTTAEERELVRKELEAMEHILGSSDQEQSKVSFPDLLKNAKAKLEPILGRVTENKQMIKSIKEARDFIIQTFKQLNGTSAKDKKQQAKLTDSQAEEIKTKINEFESWLTSKEQEFATAASSTKKSAVTKELAKEITKMMKNVEKQISDIKKSTNKRTSSSSISDFSVKAKLGLIVVLVLLTIFLFLFIRAGCSFAVLRQRISTKLSRKDKKQQQATKIKYT